MTAAYDDQNIFAKILRGEIPCHKVHEDEQTLAFMDIMPIVDGHCLVIPKAPARNIFDVGPESLATLVKAAQLVSKAACKAFGADGHVLRLHSEAAGGQEVFHIHFHVLPMKTGVPVRPRAMADHALLAEHAGLIRAAF
ncbi:HIT domain-containing protein [Labrys wisconsinensis]|uniref:Histidine triad (HIT) family protein n=1 Tax=Labrys wisconsinensis TaxID=425677 RepID=A0ABU0J6C8_9HYPH|nr:HIT domain-containing protein [Labrys wisconsinensis]MDQ0469018.1 histidine triad (HIT) family protein [Labrys wisconsinensis]